MEVTQGNMANLFQGLKAMFMTAIEQSKPPELAERFTLDTSSTGASEEYPTAALLGDLEELLDELAMTNLAEYMQTIRNRRFERGVTIPRDHVEDDNLGMYPGMVAELGRLAVTHPWRMLPRVFIAGLVTAWVDAANIWSNAHAWPGGQVWDNLDQQALNVTGYRIVCQNLMNRLGPNGQSLQLMPTHLVTGPNYRYAAKNIVARGLVGGGNTNIHYEEVEPVVWSDFTGNNAYDWFVADLRNYRPVVLQNRSGPDFESQTSPTDDEVFYRERFAYKAARRYGLAVVCPWLVQYSRGRDDGEATTTTPAG